MKHHSIITMLVAHGQKLRRYAGRLYVAAKRLLRYHVPFLWRELTHTQHAPMTLVMAVVATVAMPALYIASTTDAQREIHSFEVASPSAQQLSDWYGIEDPFETGSCRSAHRSVHQAAVDEEVNADQSVYIVFREGQRVQSLQYCLGFSSHTIQLPQSITT